MKEKFINSSISFISKYEECDDLKMKKLKYGLEGIYNLLVKLVVILLIAILTNTIAKTALLILFYAGIRTFSFGWHAKSSLGCWISSLLVYIIIPVFLIDIPIKDLIGYIILGISLISMILWAPADTPKRPLIRKRQRLKAKIISIIIVILYSIMYLAINISIIKNVIIYALLIQTILINPITYKITNTRFNNYKYYKKKVE